MKTGKLKPCPFCGNIIIRQSHANKYEWGLIWCPNCYAQTNSYKKDKEAIEAWNKRTNERADKDENKMDFAER